MQQSDNWRLPGPWMLTWCNSPALFPPGITSGLWWSISVGLWGCWWPPWPPPEERFLYYSRIFFFNLRWQFFKSRSYDFLAAIDHFKCQPKGFQSKSKIPYCKRDAFEEEFWHKNGKVCQHICIFCQNRKIHTGPTVDFVISDCSRGHHIRLRGHHSCLCGHCSICWSETRIRWLGQFLRNIIFSNFSCMLLNPNNFFQLEILLF